MSLSNFIPEVWSAQLLKQLRKNLVAAQSSVCNNDYEGEIKNHGDTVRINSIGPVTIFDYTKDVDMAAPQVLSSSAEVLVIDQAKGFNFAVDDIDKAQMNVNVMQEAMSLASYGIADKMDQFLLGLYTKVAGTVGASGGGDATAITPTSSNVYEALVNANTYLNENNVPRDGRFAIVPPFFEGWLLKDSRFVSYGTVANRDDLANGAIGRAAGMDIMVSNNVSNASGSDYKCIAGHRIAWTCVSDVVAVRAYEPQYRLADAVKGLTLYGATVTRPEALCVLHCNKS
jgi:N4-gp56 family major capsid protein